MTKESKTYSLTIGERIAAHTMLNEYKGGLALMSKVLAGKPDMWPKQPEHIVNAQVCELSGLLPPNDGDDKGCAVRTEFFIKGTVPAQRENLRQSVVIDKDTGDIVEPNKPDAHVETQEHQVVHDALGTLWCLDCTHDENKPILVK